MKKIILLVSLLAAGLCARAEGVFVECESFADKGGWVLDQQFIDEMGSSYVLAHGETIRDVGLRFAVKPERIMKMNHLTEGVPLKKGMKLKLR